MTGNVIDLESLPVQDNLLRLSVLSSADQQALDVAMQEFIIFDNVEKCSDFKTDQAVHSTSSPSSRKMVLQVILNLKQMNDGIEFSHFKINTIKDVLHMLSLK